MAKDSSESEGECLQKMALNLFNSNFRRAQKQHMETQLKV